MKSKRVILYPEHELAPFKHRNNMVEATSETWRPQLFAATNTRLSVLLAAFRRFFDIQAGSAWRDLSAVLPLLQGTVLDVGCGAQPFRSLFSRRTTYLGIDTDAAKAHFGYEMPTRPTFRVMSGPLPTPQSTSCYAPKPWSTYLRHAVFYPKLHAAWRLADCSC